VRPLAAAAARACLLAVLLLAFAVALAVRTGETHELRPAYLELRETAPGRFDVLWKTPMRGEARLALTPVVSGESAALPPVTRRADNAAIQTWILRVDSLRGRTLAIAGLEGTMTDALVRVEFLDGSGWTDRLTPRRPAATVPERMTGRTVAAVYFTLGVEHILEGLDHLLFVLALLILTRGGWRLVRAITAFTVAHSVTLALATLGVVHVPQRPVEAAIALSIVILATEIVHGWQGRVGLTLRRPWIVAFAFGLLHGLGFAGALSAIGLPEGRIPLALLFFNLGVEAGQLLFVAAILAAVAVTRRAGLVAPRWAHLAQTYAIGTLAAFWTIERVVA